MSSRQSTLDYIVEQMAKAGVVSARKMFGEYGIYCDGKMVALVWDDQLFVKQTAGGRDFIGDVTEGAPYKGAKPCFVISPEGWDDHEWLADLIRISTVELPAPVKKPRAKKAPPATSSRPRR
ncbi:TfoX/Sxy family protein [Methylocystis sp. IM3]|uniref:TfoX/Sxy family protein n=1 Tax=unclassified Methylocystis TaxID=2625913 RepID=UPI000FB060CD|nr:MAG: TfoX family protein [Hyphomicrobiales bacterium]